MRFRDLAIKRKMILIIMATNTVAVLLVCAGFVVHEVVAFRRSMLGELSILGGVISANCTAALAFDDRAAAQETLGALRADRHIVVAAVYDAEGGVFATYVRDAGKPGSLPPSPGPDGHRFGDGQLTLFHAIELGEQDLGTLFLVSDLEALRRRLSRYAIIVAVVIFSSSVVALLLSSRLQQLISQPILRLAHSAAAVSKDKDYSVRVVKSGNDEIGTLIDTFNEMLQQIRAHEAALVERSQQLLLANKELESFSYSVSHDLRVPLRAIDGFSQILVEEHGAELGQEAQRLLQIVRSSTKQMGQLIDDLLSFSRYGRRELDWSHVDMTSLTQAVVEELLALEPARRVQVEIEDLPPAQGDRKMLRQVLVNLLANALKFTRRQTAPRVTVSSSRAPGATTYCVRDNGVGFDMRYADKLFNVFQRLHGADEFEGTGVGLAIVQRIVHRHGGRVWGEAVLGQGATFCFTLPESRASAAAPAPAGEHEGA